jgi:SRSO17 transposase
VTLSQLERKQGQLRAALEAAAARLAPHFPNPAARATATAYLQSLLSTVERKNSWQLAEAVGLANPYPFQHLLGRAQWDAEAVRDAHRQDVLAGLGQEDAVLAIDETGVIKKGDKSAGVARQYCGASGKIENCQVGVFLSWQTAKGHALIDRVLYLPQEWTDDPAGGRHPRGGDLCDQTRVGPPVGRTGLGGRGPSGLGSSRRRLRGRQ